MADSDWDPLEAMSSLPVPAPSSGGINFPIDNSVAFMADSEKLGKTYAGELGPDDNAWIYSRHQNPTVVHLSRMVAALEGAEAAYCCSSGMNAVCATIFQICSNGDHIVAASRLYSGSFTFLVKYLPRVTGITVSLVDIRDHAAVEKALSERPTRLFFFETVSNPVLTVADVPRLCAMARAHGAMAVVDNTLTPCIVSPIKHGADVVIHSLTKFLNGSGDVLAGAVCGTRDFIKGLADSSSGAAYILGGTMTPLVAALIASRLPHAGMRMREHCARTLELARRLRAVGAKVSCPNLEDHPEHEVLKRISNPGYGLGALLTVDAGSSEAARALIRMLDSRGFARGAGTLGFQDTLLSYAGTSNSYKVSEEIRSTLGVRPGLVRMSIGYTGSLEQQWEVLHGALLELHLVPKQNGQPYKSSNGHGNGHHQ